jgi:hypothetical protein
MDSRWVVAMALMAALAGCAESTNPQDASDAVAVETETAAVDCLAGRTLTEEGLPITGVTVTVREVSRQAATDEKGRFAVCGLEPTTYTLVANKTGFAPAAVRVQVPQAEPVDVLLEAVAFVEPWIDVLSHTLHWTIGSSTLDTTTSRYGVNLTTCDPCDYTFTVDALPDILYIEADWTRTYMPPAGGSDIMYHILRGGAPFAEGEDIGSGSKSQPWAFNYPAHVLRKAELASNGDGSWTFALAVYCAGNVPCVDQQIDVYVSLLYEHDRVPKGYTALPPDG